MSRELRTLDDRGLLKVSGGSQISGVVRGSLAGVGRDELPVDDNPTVDLTAASFAAGDLLFAVAYQGGGATFTSATKVATAGWTLIAESPAGTNGARIYYKISDGTETAVDMEYCYYGHATFFAVRGFAEPSAADISDAQFDDGAVSFSAMSHTDYDEILWASAIQSGFGPSDFPLRPDPEINLADVQVKKMSTSFTSVNLAAGMMETTDAVDMDSDGTIGWVLRMGLRSA